MDFKTNFDLFYRIAPSLFFYTSLSPISVAHILLLW